MPVANRTRQRRADLRPPEVWQEAYLLSSGRHLGPPDFERWLDIMPFWRLYEGRRPVDLDPARAKHPFRLWQDHGEPYLKQFVKKNPGSRPLPWWQWEAPGAADPAMDAENYVKAIEKAQTRARWTPEKQRAFLGKHNLLCKGE